MTKGLVFYLAKPAARYFQEAKKLTELKGFVCLFVWAFCFVLLYICWRSQSFSNCFCHSSQTKVSRRARIDYSVPGSRPGPACRKHLIMMMTKIMMVAIRRIIVTATEVTVFNIYSALTMFQTHF